MKFILAKWHTSRITARNPQETESHSDRPWQECPSYTTRNCPHFTFYIFYHTICSTRAYRPQSKQGILIIRKKLNLRIWELPNVTFNSSRGTISTRKSKMSPLVMAPAISFLWRVRRLFSSVWIQERNVNSKINISHAFEKSTGASAAIICSSNSQYNQQL